MAEFVIQTIWLVDFMDLIKPAYSDLLLQGSVSYKCFKFYII